MKKFFIGIIMMLALGVNNSSLFAQSVVREGNVFKVTSSSKAVRDTLVSKGRDGQPFYYQTSKGDKFAIILRMNKNDNTFYSLYVVRVSAKTHKLYRQTIKDENIIKDISSEMGIKYVPKEK